MSRPDTPRLGLLSEARVEQILTEAFGTLEKIGVHIGDEDAIDLLSSVGARVSDDRRRVHMPQSLCQRCIESIPKSFDLYDRAGEKATAVGDDHLVFNPGSTATVVYDYAARRIRPPLTRDAIEFAILTDRLRGIDAQSTAVVPSDVPGLLSDRYRLFLALIYGRKPVITGTFTQDGFSQMLAQLTVVRGNAALLRDRPLAVFDCCPTPPLKWSELTCQALMACARNGIPAEIVSMPLAGATSPVTLAGTLVQHTAETLSGVVIHQTVYPGAPLVYGGASACFDMRRGTPPMGAAETMMLQLGHVQIARVLQIPSHVYMGLSDSKVPDYQAGFETAAGATLAALAGANVVSGPGMLSFVGCQSLEKLILDNEICLMARRLVEGISFREESAGLQALIDMAMSGSFLSSDHTRRFFRDEILYPSDVVDRSDQTDWEKSGSLDASERAHRTATALLAERDETQSPLGNDVIEELAAIMDANARTHGVLELPDWRTHLP